MNCRYSTVSTKVNGKNSGFKTIILLEKTSWMAMICTPRKCMMEFKLIAHSNKVMFIHYTTVWKYIVSSHCIFTFVSTPLTTTGHFLFHFLLLKSLPPIINLSNFAQSPGCTQLISGYSSSTVIGCLCNNCSISSKLFSSQLGYLGRSRNEDVSQPCKRALFVKYSLDEQSLPHTYIHKKW